MPDERNMMGSDVLESNMVFLLLPYIQFVCMHIHTHTHTHTHIYIYIPNM
jgi:hypothetical protein